MAFPLNPIDGTSYTSPSGILYKYISTSNSWNIVPIIGVDDNLSGGVADDAGALLQDFYVGNVWSGQTHKNTFFNVSLELTIPEFSGGHIFKIDKTQYQEWSGYNYLGRTENILSTVLTEFSGGHIFKIDKTQYQEWSNYHYLGRTENILSTVISEWSSNETSLNYNLQDNTLIEDYSTGSNNYFFTLTI